MLRARASILYGSGSPGVITIYGVAGTEGTTEAGALSTRLQTALTSWSGLFSSDTTTFVSDGYADVINPATGVLTDRLDTVDWTVVPTAGGGQSPPALALCMSWMTSTFIAGRRVRGRTFLSPLAGGVSGTDGLPISAVVTAANSGADDWIDAGITGVDTVVWHRPVGGTGGSTAVVTAHHLDPEFAVLRSRRD